MNYSLRPWEYTDGPALTKAADDPLVARYLRDFFPNPYKESDALQFITYCKSTPEYLEINRCIEVGGSAAGSISLRFGTDVARMNAELGYWLAQPFWGRGIMTAAVREVVEYGFRDWEIHRIFAEVYAPNLASQRVLEHNGFVREGIFKEAVLKGGHYLDLFVYSKLAPGGG